MIKRLFFILLPVIGFTQSGPMDLSYQYRNTLSRMQVKGYLQKDFMPDILPFEKAHLDTILRTTDEKLLNPIEYKNFIELGLYELNADKPFTNYYRDRQWLYKNPTHFFQYQSGNLELTIDPIFNLQAGIKNNDKIGGAFQRGIDLYVNIDNRFTFYSQVIEGPLAESQHVRDYTNRFQTLPFYGFYKEYRNDLLKDYPAYDLLYAKGGIGAKITDHIGLTFGFDSNFIGHGIRSVMLSHFAGNYLNLKLNTKIWKFHYTNIFAEIHEDNYRLFTGDDLVKKKYFAAHYLKFNPTRNLSIGLFESVVFGRENHFELQYLNPIILYRTVEHAVGSPDNVNLGITLDWILFKKVRWYNQLLFDEIKVTELFGGNGWWANKYALQTGLEFIDPLRIENMMIKFEYNRVRPYTYAHRNTITTYTHNNAPLAHPLGANFSEILTELEYQFAEKWKLYGLIMLAKQGKSDDIANYGEVVQLTYNDRVDNYGIETLQGNLVKTAMVMSELQYEIMPNYILNLTGSYRKTNETVALQNQLGFQAGIRINFHPRQFVF